MIASVFAGSAGADTTAYRLQCGSQTYTVTKPNESAAVYTNGSVTFVTAIGYFKSDGSAQPQAVQCTLNGFGPIPFVITPGH